MACYVIKYREAGRLEVYKWLDLVLDIIVQIALFVAFWSVHIFSCVALSGPGLIMTFALLAGMLIMGLIMGRWRINSLARSYILPGCSNAKVGYILYYIVKLFFLVCFCLFLFDFGKALIDDKYYFQKVTVPEEFQKQGLTSSLISKIVLDCISFTDTSVASNRPSFPKLNKAMDKFDVPVVEGDIEYEGLSYQSIVNFFANHFSERKSIQCEVVKKENNGVTIITTISGVKNAIEVYSDDSLETMDKLVYLSYRIAQEVLRKIDPVNFALYKYGNDDWQGCIDFIDDYIPDVQEKQEKAGLLMLKGYCERILKHYESSRECFRKSLAFDRNNYNTYANLAATFLQGDKTDSFDYYHNLSLSFTTNSPYEKGLFFNLEGCRFSILGNDDSAVVYFKKAVQCFSDDILFPSNLAKTYATLGKYDTATVWFDWIRSNFRDNSQVMENLKECLGFAAGKNFMKKLMQNDSSIRNYKYGYYQLGLFCSNTDPNKAIDYFNKAMELDPNFNEALYQMANVQSYCKDYLSTNTNIEDAYKNSANPKMVEAWATNLSGQGAGNLALKKLGEIPGNASTAFYRAKAYDVANKTQHAEFNYLLADLLCGHQQPTLLALANLEFKLKRYDLAMSYADEVLELDTENLEGLELIARIYMTKHMTGLALDIGHRLLANGPSWIAYDIIAEASEILPDREEAYYNYRQAVQYRPDDAKAISYIACYLLTKERYKEALPWFKKLERFVILTGVDCDNFGACLAHVGEYAHAILMYKKAYLLDPNDCLALKNWYLALKRLNKDPFHDFVFTSSLAGSKCDLTNWFASQGIKYTN